MDRPRERKRIGGKELLGKTLKRHRRENFRVTQPVLSKNLIDGRNIKGHALEEKPRSDLILDKKRFIGRLERAEIEELEFGDLPFIADLYQISVISLVYSVSEEVPFAHNTLRENDYTPIPFGIPNTKGFRYLIPNYRLANSSLILLILQLQPGGHSPRDHKKHKEDEVLEVIEGEVIVEFPANEVHLSEGDRIHYKDVEHVITNPSKDSEAIVFVQRELAELAEIRRVRV